MLVAKLSKTLPRAQELLAKWRAAVLAPPGSHTRMQRRVSFNDQLQVHELSVQSEEEEGNLQATSAPAIMEKRPVAPLIMKADVRSNNGSSTRQVIVPKYDSSSPGNALASSRHAAALPSPIKAPKPSPRAHPAMAIISSSSLPGTVNKSSVEALPLSTSTQASVVVGATESNTPVMSYTADSAATSTSSLSIDAVAMGSSTLQQSLLPLPKRQDHSNSEGSDGGEEEVGRVGQRSMADGSDLHDNVASDSQVQRGNQQLSPVRRRIQSTTSSSIKAADCECKYRPAMRA